MRSLLTVFALVLLACACSSTSTPRAQKWVEFGIVAEDGPIPTQTGKPYPFFGEESSSKEPVRLEQPLLRCRVASATLSSDRLGFPAAYVILADRDASQFEAFTAANVNREMAVLVEGRIVTKANIGEKLPGRFQLGDKLTEAEAAQLLEALQ
jgi:hypothetical protein